MQIAKAFPIPLCSRVIRTRTYPTSSRQRKSFSTMTLRKVIILTSNVNKSRKFYCDILGSRLLNETDSTLEIQAGSMSLILKASHNIPPLSTGCSPIITFDVKEMENVVRRAIAHGATLDGPIKYPVHGKFASMRSPDGHMISLFESPL